MTELLDFAEALKCLQDGKCLGIRPDNGTNGLYAEMWKPDPERGDWRLRWKGSDSDEGFLVGQYLGKWCLVIADHRQFAETQKKPTS